MSGPGAYFLNLTNNGLTMMYSVWVTETGDAMELGDSMMGTKTIFRRVP